MALIRHENGGIELGLEQAADRANDRVKSLANLVQPQIWQVGDLIRLPDQEPSLVIYLDHDDSWLCYLGLIGQNGSISELKRMSRKRDNSFSHNTGLVYQFANRVRAEQDFKNGLFTPYFDIL